MRRQRTAPIGLAPSATHLGWPQLSCLLSTN